MQLVDEENIRIDTLGGQLDRWRDQSVDRCVFKTVLDFNMVLHCAGPLEMAAGLLFTRRYGLAGEGAGHIACCTTTAGSSGLKDFPDLHQVYETQV